eukprot:snap_masked-scaffold_25-processed-gene-3.48-mRNA-1 protein AED:1.00 eAED:1.00 QI:0/-1/0/0/-1/1/1/0/249
MSYFHQISTNTESREELLRSYFRHCDERKILTCMSDVISIYVPSSKVNKKLCFFKRVKYFEGGSCFFTVRLCYSALFETDRSDLSLKTLPLFFVLLLVSVIYDLLSFLVSTLVILFAIIKMCFFFDPNLVIRILETFFVDEQTKEDRVRLVSNRILISEIGIFYNRNSFEEIEMQIFGLTIIPKIPEIICFERIFCWDTIEQIEVKKSCWKNMKRVKLTEANRCITFIIPQDLVDIIKDVSGNIIVETE